MVSVIIPVYNRYDELKRAVLSAAFQSVGMPVEIIVVDDNSPRDVRTFLEATLPGDILKNIVFIRNSENKKHGICRNIAVSRAKGEFILFLDSDDIWIFDKIERQLDLMRRLGAGIVCSNGFWSSGGLLNNIFEDVVIGRERFILDGFLMLPSGWMVKKDVFNSLGGFDEAFVNGWEDGDFLARAFGRGIPVAFQAEPLVVWSDSGSDRYSRKRRAMILARLQFLDKNRDILNDYADYKYRMFRSMIKDAIAEGDKELARSILSRAVKEFPNKRLSFLSKAVKISLM